jgi:CDP-glucose 4,6-dehydratase
LESYTDPVGTYATNVMGTVHLLDAVRQCPSVRAVVNVTTDKCYHNREWLWGYREDDQLGGRDPYSNSKACAELVTMAYRASFLNPDRYAEHGVAIATARAGNVIGGGDWAAQRLIPDLLAAFERGVAAPLRQPNAVRPWQHVLEPLRGYLMLAERLWLDGPAWGDAWNFGPNESDARPVHAVATALAAHWGEGARWTRHPEAATVHEATLLQLSSAKAHQQLQWHPALTLDASLALVVDWHKAWCRGEDMQAMTQRQIDAYQSLHLHALTS